MSGPPTNLYYIRDPRGRYIGAVSDGNPVSPVAVDGTENVWSVIQLPDGNYNLDIDYQVGNQPDRYSVGNNGNVVAVDTKPVAPDGVWTIIGRGGGDYSIQEPTDGVVIPPVISAWSLENQDENTPVVLRALDAPGVTNTWNFLPAPSNLKRKLRK